MRETVTISAIQALAEADPVFVEASWFLPGSGMTGEEVFEERRLPRAVYFDIDGVCDTTSALPHMAPGAAAFARFSSARTCSHASIEPAIRCVSSPVCRFHVITAPSSDPHTAYVSPPHSANDANEQYRSPFRPR